MTGLIQDPRGHKLYVADYKTDRTEGLIMICSKCGHITEGQRASGLLADCNKEFRSDHTKSNWTRFKRLQHPSHAKGPGKVLVDPAATFAER